MKTRIYAAAAVLMSCASCSMDEIVYSDMTAGEYYANFSESDVHQTRKVDTKNFLKC